MDPLYPEAAQAVAKAESVEAAESNMEAHP